MGADWVVLKVFENPMDAGLAKSILERHGMVCVVASEGMSLYPTLGVGGNRLLVHPDDLEDARQALQMDPPADPKARLGVIKGGKG